MLAMVMFDADGVLFESIESNTAYYNAIFKALEVPELTPAEIAAAVFMSAGQVFELRARGDRRLVELMHVVAARLDPAPFFALLRHPPELKSFLSELRRRFRLGLATNRSVTVPGLIRHLDLGEVFDAIASAHDAVRPKPAPDILELCLQRAGVAAAQAVYVGDSPYDLEAAQAAGMHFIGVGPRVESELRIARLEQLPEVLERLAAPD